MFYQIFLSAQVKRWAIITYKHCIYELPHELPNDLRLLRKDLRKLGNIRKVSKVHIECQPSAQTPSQNNNSASTRAIPKYPATDCRSAPARTADAMSLKRSDALKIFFYLKNNTDMQKKCTPECDVLSKIRIMVDKQNVYQSMSKLCQITCPRIAAYEVSLYI